MDDHTNEINIRKLNNQLRAGIRAVLLSDNFKNFLETQSRFFLNRYSLRNTLLIRQQIPDPSYVMGAEDWKRYGRQVTNDAKGAFIFIPEYPARDTKYLDWIKLTLHDMFMANPDLILAKKRIGNSNIEFTLQKNGIWGVEAGEAKIRFSSEDEFTKFYWKNLANRLPVSYTIGKVFDIKDTLIPEHLWVKNNFSLHEAVLDDFGYPVQNEYGEFKIKNSAERIFRFVDKLDFTIPKNDEIKMNLLFTALKDVCKNNEISIEAVDRVLIDNGDDCDGRYNHEDKRFQYANDLSLERRISVTFHELTHVLLHSNLQELSTALGVDRKEINRNFLEIQAEATAYLTAKKFGIETDTDSFYYLAEFSNSLDLRELEKSMNVIHKAANSLLNLIEKELIKSGYNLSLEPVPVTEMNKDQLTMYASRYLEDAVIQRSAEYANALQSIAADYEKVSDAERDNIEDQIRCLNKINQAISETKVLLYKLSNTAMNEKSKIIGIIERLDAILNSIHRNETKFNYLVNEHMDILKEGNNLVSLFSKEPMKALNWLKNRYTELENLSKREIDYIALSKTILDDYSYLLRNDRDTPIFINAATQRAYYVDDMSSRNGVFIEINYMEHFDTYNKPALSRGELCHPKYADTVIQEAEQSIKRLKAIAKEKNEYYPYSRCDLTVFSPSAQGGLNAMRTSLDIGDKNQTSLTDHLRQCCKTGPQKEIYRGYEKALHDFIWDFHVTPKIPVIEDVKENRVSNSVEKGIEHTAPQHEINDTSKKQLSGSYSKMDIGEGA